MKTKQVAIRTSALAAVTAVLLAASGSGGAQARNPLLWAGNFKGAYVPTPTTEQAKVLPATSKDFYPPSAMPAILPAMLPVIMPAIMPW